MLNRTKARPELSPTIQFSMAKTVPQGRLEEEDDVVCSPPQMTGDEEGDRNGGSSLSSKRGGRNE